MGLRVLGGRSIVGKLLSALLISRDLHFPALGLQKSDFVDFMIKVKLVQDSARDGLNISLWRSSGSPGLQNVAFPNGIPTVLRMSLHAKIDFPYHSSENGAFPNLGVAKARLLDFRRQNVILGFLSELK